MSSKPVVWIPRRLSDATIARAKQNYEIILNEADAPGTAEDIIAMSAKADAMLSRRCSDTGSNPAAGARPPTRSSRPVSVWLS